MKARMTKRMKVAEEKLGAPLDATLQQLFNDTGSLSLTAEYLEVSKATLGYWLLKFGFRVRKVVVASDETLIIRDSRGNDRMVV